MKPELPNDHVSSAVRAAQLSAKRFRRAKNPALDGVIAKIDSAIVDAQQLVKTGARPMTPKEKAQMGRDVAKHAAEVRERNERMGALRKQVAERREALESATTDAERWRAQELLDLALERLRVAR